MIVGEDRNKIRNIVTPNMSHFSELYKPYTDSFLEETTDGLLYRVCYDPPPPQKLMSAHLQCKHCKWVVVYAPNTVQQEI